MSTQFLFFSKSIRKLLPVAGVILMAVTFFGFGLGIQMFTNTRLTPMDIAEQPVQAASSDIAPSAIASDTQTTVLTTTTQISPTILLETASTRASLFQNDVQSHLKQSEQSITIDGIEMNVSNIYALNGHVFVSICFSQPGEEAWQLGPTTLYYPDGEITSFYGHVTRNEIGSVNGKVGWQCNTLEFVDLPAGTNLSQLSLNVESILLAAPDEGMQCEVYNKRLAQSARLKNLGIQAMCNTESGYLTFEIISKPSQMTQDEALLIIGQESAGFVVGNWQFEKLPNP